MNTARLRKILFFSLLFSFTILLSGCVTKSEIKKTITDELNLLKNLDSETVRKYISYDELFPDTSGGFSSTDEIEEVFSLFFKDFDYKIMDIDIDNKTDKADASVRFFTIDANSLAKDFMRELLKAEILKAASDSPEDASGQSLSMEDHYLLLNHLLKSNSYKRTETNCIIELILSDSQNDQWEIKRTVSLENNLVGGLMAYLSDPDILSPEETLDVYLSTIKNMSLEEMVSYLDLEAILNSDDPDKSKLAEALANQMHKHFDFSLGQCAVNGYQATVPVDITTFDSNAILSAYQTAFEKYLESSDAVIDGSEKRRQKSLEFLLKTIKENTQTKTDSMDFTLINDGISWKLQNGGKALSQAFFGDLSSSDNNLL